MNLENKIPNGWVETTLGEVCNNISRKFPFDSKNQIIFINTGDVLNGIFLHKKYISKIGLPGQAKKGIKKGDILFSEIRPKNKRFAIVDFNAKDYVVSTKFMVIRFNEKVIDLEFLYIFLTSDKKINEFNIIAESRSGTFPQITFDSISYIKLLLPPLKEQVAIAKTLTAFDDKIENLQAQNNTLETTAQTIFKEWFGKYQIGDELPEGWRIGKLGDISKHIKVNIKPFNNPNKDYYHYSLPGYDNGLMPSLDKGNTIKSNKYSVTDNSFLVSKLNPFTPRIWTIFNSEESAICSTEFQVLKPQKQCFFSLIHCILNSKYFTSELSQKLQGTSSSHQRVKPQDIFDVRIIIPNNNTLSDFDLLVSPLILKKSINHSQIQTLKKTRDTLLPKLMNGELRVKI